MSDRTSIPARTPEVVSRSVGDDFVVIHPSTQTAHSLTGATALVWAATEGAELPQLASADLEAAIAELTALDLLQAPGLSRRSMLKRAGMFAGGAGVVSIATVALPEAVAAASTTYSFMRARPGTFTTKVPKNVTAVTFTVVGAGGGGAQLAGQNQDPYGFGGSGATLSGTITFLTPGPHDLTIVVGQGGAGDPAGVAINAGGTGFGAGGNSYAGAGGGGTAIEINGQVIVVAGAGGGGGSGVTAGAANNNGDGFGGAGGDAGAIDGANGRSVAEDGLSPGRTPPGYVTPTGGSGGKTTPGGAKVPGKRGKSGPGGNSGPDAPADGDGETGGRGGDAPINGNVAAGGGGGGGYAGGGGGGTSGDTQLRAYGAGGGGGSSYFEGISGVATVSGLTGGLASNGGSRRKDGGDGLVTLTQA